MLQQPSCAGTWSYVCICACRRHVSSVVFLVRMFILCHSLSEIFHFIVLVRQCCVTDHFLFMSIWNINNVVCGPFACTFLGVQRHVDK